MLHLWISFSAVERLAGRTLVQAAQTAGALGMAAAPQ
jgi:hypothetical protein